MFLDADEILAKHRFHACHGPASLPPEKRTFHLLIHPDISCANDTYNFFERQIDRDVLPYVREKNLSTLAYGSLCRGLLTGTMKPDTKFTGDDLRQSDPKFQPPRFAQYLNAVQQLDDLAQTRYGKHVMDLAVRWVLDQPGITAALWGARSWKL